MITVTVAINGLTLFTRSARNNSKVNKKGETQYIVDTSEEIWHKRNHGAVKLCKKLLDTINEEMEERKRLERKL